MTGRDPVVVDNVKESRYEILVQRQVAGAAVYRRTGSTVTFLHAVIDPEWAGRGLGAILAPRALDAAREEAAAVLPFCPFIREYIQRHPDYLDLVFPAQPEPEIARSARLLGAVHVGAGAILAQGLVVRSHDGAVHIGNHSAILENGVVVGTRQHPVRIGQRTVFGHRAQIIGATVGDLSEVGNGAILMPGAQLGDGCILGEGTLIPAGASSRRPRSWWAVRRTSSAPPPTPTANAWRCSASTRPASPTIPATAGPPH